MLKGEDKWLNMKKMRFAPYPMPARKIIAHTKSHIILGGWLATNIAGVRR